MSERHEGRWCEACHQKHYQVSPRCLARKAQRARGGSFLVGTSEIRPIAGAGCDGIVRGFPLGPVSPEIRALIASWNAQPETHGTD